MGIGKRLRSMRHNMNMTLKDLSAVLGVSPNSVYRWENDLAVPRKAALNKMAEFYRVPVRWLINGITVEEDIPMLSDNSFEQSLLSICRKLPEKSKYKILGYAERIWVEEMNMESLVSPQPNPQFAAQYMA